MTNDITISFYQNTSELVKIDKNLISVGSVYTGKIHQNYSYPNLVIALSASEISFELTEVNYCRINGVESGYFYIVNRTFDSGIVYLTLKKDVLMSYSNDIKNIRAIIARNENRFNLYINDEIFKSYAYPKTQIKEFPSGFSDNYSIILNVSGKVEGVS